MIPPNLTLTQLRYFLAVAEARSYTEAARVLHVSQPPLSKQIALLEAELGFQLFRREPRGVSLTPAGEYLAVEVRLILQGLEASAGRVRSLAEGAVRQIRLAIPEAMVLEPLQVAIRTYLETQPSREIQVLRYPMNRTREALLQGEVDLLFTLSFELPGLPECDALDLGKREGRWILSRAHPLASCKSLNLAEEKGLTLIRVGREMSPSGFEWFDKVCDLEGFQPAGVLEAPSWEALLTLVELGHGIAMVGRPLAERNANRFAAFEPGPRVPAVGLILAWRRDCRNPAVRAFLTWLEGFLRD